MKGIYKIKIQVLISFNISQVNKNCMDQIIKHQCKDNWEFSYICIEEPNPVNPQEDYFSTYYLQLAQNFSVSIYLPSQDTTKQDPLDCKEETSYSKIPQKKASKDEEWSDNRSSQRPQRRKRKKNPKRPYPTKNLLPVFKPHILGYIRNHYKDYHLHPLIKTIQEKNSINLQDYQTLFNTAEFRNILAAYFKSKKIYRDLFQSRIDYDRKRLYFLKVHVFQQAFWSGKFKKIN